MQTYPQKEGHEVLVGMLLMASRQRKAAELHGWNSADPPLRFRPQVPVPRHSVGVVIGRSGEMIKKIQNDAGVRIQFKQGQGQAMELYWPVLSF